jgi:hypothetical protein
MREYLKGKKAYGVAALAVLLGVYGWATGELTPLQAIDYVLGGSALSSMRAAIAKL